jgi:hypothetical protein
MAELTAKACFITDISAFWSLWEAKQRLVVDPYPSEK